MADEPTDKTCPQCGEDVDDADRVWRQEADGVVRWWHPNHAPAADEPLPAA